MTDLEQDGLDQDRLDRLRDQVLAGAPRRHPGGPSAARTRGRRRRAARLGGIAAAVVAIAVCVPVGLALVDGVPTATPVQVASPSAAPVESPVPDRAPPTGPVDPATTPTPETTTTEVPEAAPTVPDPSGPPAEPLPVGALRVDGPPAEDLPALAGATATTADGGESGQVGFTSPSGNILCGAYVVPDDNEVECRVVLAGWSVGRPAECDLDWSSDSVTLGRSGEEPAVGRLGRCASDTLLVPDPVVLPYGTALVIGGIRCTSLETGITCQDTASGSGFRASRSSALVW